MRGPAAGTKAFARCARGPVGRTVRRKPGRWCRHPPPQGVARVALPYTQVPLPGSALATPSAPCAGHLPPLEQFDIAIRLRTPLAPAAVSAAVRFLVDQGLPVLDVDQRGAVIEARGSVMAMSRAFRVQLRAYAGPDGVFRGRRGLVYLPPTLVDAIVGVDGLDARPDGSRPRPVTSDARPITIDLRA